MIRIFRVVIPGSALALFLAEVVLFYSAFIVSVTVMMDIPADIFLLYEGGLGRISVAVASLVLGMYFQDLYSDLSRTFVVHLLQQVCLALGGCFLTQAFLGYLDLNFLMPRWVMLMAGLLILVVVPLNRILFTQALLSKSGAQRILFVGCNELVQSISGRLKARPEFGLSSVGYLSDGPDGGTSPLGEPLGKVADLTGVFASLHPDRVVIGMTERRGAMPVFDLLELRMSGAVVEDAANLFESLFGRVSVAMLRPSQLIFSGELGPRKHRVAWQALYSSLIAVVGMIVSLPLALLVAILVKLTSSGPVLLRQTRVGKNGKNFTLLKFRSMFADAESDTGAVWASKDDLRVTPVGRWLRRFRLDELPQFINVLRGDMSIVGPRPERPEFVDELSRKIPFYRQRLCVKPGLTGWAQINHKYTQSVEDTVVKLEYDLYYIKNLGPSLDLYIILNTLKVVLLSRGAL